MEQNYQNQQPPGNYQRQEPLPNATVILILGILSIILCQPLGIAALIMGNNSLALYNRNPEQYTEGSYSTVKAGRICGIIGICLIAVWIILMIAGVSLFSFMGTRDHNY
jgi:flagellar basal body-associated protein FliL